MAKLEGSNSHPKIISMIRKVTFYWTLLTLILVNSWLLSKPNLLGKIGLIIYKYHYLRSFPRTLLTVWIVISVSALIVLLVQYLMKQQVLSKTVSMIVLSAFLVSSILILVKVSIDFTAWSYSHTGLKFRIGAHMLPALLIFVFTNGLIQIRRTPEVIGHSEEPEKNVVSENPEVTVNHDTSLP
jgi:hypothetical protein